MDRDVDTVAMLVEDLDHLLIGLLALRIGDGHTNQTAELPDTMIDMNHEVANLELLNFLKGERHLTTTGLVALEVVLMETVEDLMISKKTDAQIVISKTFMKSVLDRGEDGGRWKVECGRWNVEGGGRYVGFEDFTQALVLLLAVGKYKNLLALQQIVFKRLREQVEVLMEQRLNGDIEVKREK